METKLPVKGDWVIAVAGAQDCAASFDEETKIVELAPCPLHQATVTLLAESDAIRGL